MRQELPRYIGKGLHDWLDGMRREPIPREWLDLISRLEKSALVKSRDGEQRPNLSSEKRKQREPSSD